MKLASMFVLFALFVTPGAAAQSPPAPAPAALQTPGPPPAPAPPAPPVDDPVRGHLFPPELVMRHQKAIGLQPEQRDRIRDEVRQAQLRFTELQWDLQDAAEALAGILSAGEVDERAALEQLDKVLAAEREIKRTQITLMIRIKNNLTPEQQGRLQELRPRAPQAPPGPAR